MSPPLGGTSSEPVNRPHAFLSDLAIPASVATASTPRANRGIPAVWIASGLFATFAILALMMQRAGLTVDPLGRSTLPFYVVGIVAIAARTMLPGSTWRHARTVADGAEYYGIFTAIALMGAVSCYPVSALTQGYADAKLQAVDVLLHFDWLAWYTAVAASPTLQLLGTAAYRSIFITPAVLLGYYAVTAQRAEAHRFIFTFWLAAIITLSLFTLMPAVGPFSYLWHAAIPYMPESELWQPDLIPQLRAHTVHVVDLGQLRGLVSAPSFHACAGTLYAASAWRVARLRWPLIAVNGAMLLSTPVEGTHYLSDILLGMSVAVVALVIVHHGVAAIRRRAA
ncbi:phosphatase PAP2 family protein [Sphingomonas sp. GB1N7]